MLTIIRTKTLHQLRRAATESTLAEQEARQRLAQVRSQRDQLERDLLDANRARSILLEATNRLQEQLDEAHAEWEELDSRFQARGAQLESATSRIAELEQELGTRYSEVNSLRRQLDNALADLDSMREENKVLRYRLAVIRQWANAVLVQPAPPPVDVEQPSE